MALPYIINGILYDTNGSTPIANIKVTLRNEKTNQITSTNTNSLGQYILDAANLTNGYSNGDILSIFVIYTNYEDYEEHTIVESDGGATINLTLVAVPASDELRYFTVQDFFDFFHLTAGASDTPATKEVVKIGVMVESGIDQDCQSRFAGSNVEIEVDDCDATTSWSGSTDATAIAVNTTAGKFKTRTGALDLGKSGVTQAFFQYIKTITKQRDFSDRVLGCFFYASSLSGLATTGTALRVKYGNDSSNYYYKDYYKADLIADWNFLYFKKDDSDVFTVGTLTDSQCDYFEIYFTMTAITDVVTSGVFILDNIFLVHEDHFNDEYMDTVSQYRYDYFVSKTPLKRLLYFVVNTADEDQAESWVELTEEDDEVDIHKETGRLRIRDIDIEDEENIRPREGAEQVRAVYLFGTTRIPKEIKKVAILMTARDLMQGAVGRALMRGQDSFKTDHYTALDSQIETILDGYRHYDIIAV